MAIAIFGEMDIGQCLIGVTIGLQVHGKRQTAGGIGIMDIGKDKETLQE